MYSFEGQLIFYANVWLGSNAGVSEPPSSTMWYWSSPPTAASGNFIRQCSRFATTQPRDQQPTNNISCPVRRDPSASSSRVVAFLQAVARPKYCSEGQGLPQLHGAKCGYMSSCWSVPVGRYLSDTCCKGSMVVLAR